MFHFSGKYRCRESQRVSPLDRTCQAHIVVKGISESVVMVASEVVFLLFDGINAEDRKTMMGCIGYQIGTFQNGDIVAFEEENLTLIGLLLFGTVDMVKEDMWCIRCPSIMRGCAAKYADQRGIRRD